MSRPRVRVPKTAEAGEVISIKTLISHKMESGLRKGKDGKIIPRKIINSFKAEFNGVEVFSVKMEPAISTNPYIQFQVRVDKSGTFKFTWVDDDGSVYETTKKITVA